MWPAAKKGLEPPDARRSRKDLPGGLQECSPAHTWNLDFWPPELGQRKLCCSKPPARDILLWQPQDMCAHHDSVRWEHKSFMVSMLRRQEGLRATQTMKMRRIELKQSSLLHH